MTDIITQIAEARGNRGALLALASSDTLDSVAHAKGVSPAYAATFVAQRLFDASDITIKSKGQPGSRIRSKRYDLTNGDQAYDALEAWGIRAEALTMWQECESHEAFVLAAEAHPTMNPNNITTELKITRHQ